MTDDELRSILSYVFEHLKEQRFAISSLLAEVAALRESLCEIGPKYREIFDRHWHGNVAENEPHLSEATRTIDEIIQQLKRRE